MTLSDGDKEQIAQAADTYFAQIPDEEQKKLGITRDTVYHFYEKLCLTDLYYEKKTKDEGQEISDEDARVIKVMYIYFKTGEKIFMEMSVHMKNPRSLRLRKKHLVFWIK